jgi:hypothetical protein
VTPAAGGGRAESTYFGRAILESRDTLHLSYRLVVRFYQWTAVSGAAAPGTGLWRTVLPAFVVLDVVTWLVLRRDRSFGLAWRLPMDAADMAFWSLSPSPSMHTYDVAVLIATPLTVEAGFRIGARGLVIVPVCMTVTLLARALAGLPLFPLTFLWLVLTVGLGAAAFSYSRRLGDQAVAARRRQRAADAGRAFLVGQNAVAMGADSVVDAIEGVVPVLGRPAQGSALWQLADGWKARLAADTAAQATYLQVALLRWESAHNRHPDLSARVELFLGEGLGTVLLTGRQVGWLHVLLDERDLRGPDLRGIVRVDLAEGASAATRPLGTALDLIVGADGHPLRIPADRSALVRPVDIAPVLYGLIAAEVVPLLLPARGGLEPWAAGVAMAICGLAAWWSHRQLARRGAAARPTVLVGAMIVAVVLTVLTGAYLTEVVSAEGDTLYQAIGLMLLSIVGGMYWHGLSRLMTGALVGVAGLIGLLGAAFAQGPPSFRSFACAVAFNVAPFPTAVHIGRSLARATKDDQEAAADEDRRATEEAFTEGQESVLALVRLARDDAQAQLASVAITLEPDVARLVGARLKEVDQRLATLAGDGLSSSTTTS